MVVGPSCGRGYDLHEHFWVEKLPARTCLWLTRGELKLDRRVICTVVLGFEHIECTLLSHWNYKPRFLHKAGATAKV